jgi:hypothetical protein
MTLMMLRRKNKSKRNAKVSLALQDHARHGQVKTGKKNTFLARVGRTFLGLRLPHPTEHSRVGLFIGGHYDEIGIKR